MVFLCLFVGGGDKSVILMATAAQLITKFNNMVDDVLDQDFALQLLNDAKDEVEGTQIWLQLLKEQAYSVSGGYSFGAAIGTLPTRFANDLRLVEDNANIEYEKVAFDDRVQKENNPLGYFIDLNAGNLHLTGQNHSAKTVYLYYTQYSADLTTSDSWAFPARFHSILPLKMAELYYAANAGEKARSWDDRWSAQFERELGRMMVWNDSLKLRNRSPRRNPSYSPKSVRG